ncbi:hypothetical protein Cfor_09818 [Coptotermes formosanus]|uniref:Uncharacterized protein n=1 Tax=Coptotermes formosanus TaxID=36987 RepID=A0A6L2Q8D3_COPFO|nr:hypothetical protein Cfor_09818 [Coptotermes formosanus]
MPGPIPFCTQGRPLQQWGRIFFLTLPTAPILATSDCRIFWLYEGCTPRTPFRGGRRAEAQRA